MASWSSGIVGFQRAGVFSLIYGLAIMWILHKLVRFFYAFLRRRLHSTPLYGPPRPSFLWGVNRMLMAAPDRIAILEEWVNKYGAVFKVPAPLGTDVVQLCDPKAISHFYSRETYGYNQTSFARMAIENLVRTRMTSVYRCTLTLSS